MISKLSLISVIQSYRASIKFKMYDPCRSKRQKLESCKPKYPKTKHPQYTDKIIDLPHFIKILGPKHFAIFRRYIPSLITYSIATIIWTVYLTEYKTVLQYMPYYSGKYVEPEKPAKVAKKSEEGEEGEEE